MRIEDRDYSTTRDVQRIDAHLRALKTRDRSVLLRTLEEVPWRCVGGILLSAQRMGLHVGFIAEPPPDLVRNEG